MIEHTLARKRVADTQSLLIRQEKSGFCNEQEIASPARPLLKNKWKSASKGQVAEAGGAKWTSLVAMKSERLFGALASSADLFE